jgi:hypothetical protein
MWDRLFEDRPIRLLYIAGRGFDLRAQTVMNEFVRNRKSRGHRIEKAELLLVSFSSYELSDELKDLTKENAHALETFFNGTEPVKHISVGSSAAGEDDLSASNALRVSTTRVLEHVTDHTDIILDVSSLPRVVYLALMTGILDKLVPNKEAPDALLANGVNFQALVAEDAALDGKIRAEDPSNDLVIIPGFSSSLYAESVQEWPMVWFPVLGENRVSQLEKVMTLAPIPVEAEICPVVPHPSRDPRRADQLLMEYRRPLFDERGTPTTNILYAHESQPFEAYRQLFRAMERYRDSLRIIGGCRLVMTPLASKLITLGVGLACFEMRPSEMNSDYGVAIPYAEPKRYVVSPEDFHDAKPEISALLLTGEAYK